MTRHNRVCKKGDAKAAGGRKAGGRKPRPPQHLAAMCRGTPERAITHRIDAQTGAASITVSPPLPGPEVQA